MLLLCCFIYYHSDDNSITSSVMYVACAAMVVMILYSRIWSSAPSVMERIMYEGKASSMLIIPMFGYPIVEALCG